MALQKTFYHKFVFSIRPIYDDLVDTLQGVQLDLAFRGQEVDLDDLICAWVMYQLERHLYLNIEVSGQRARSLEVAARLDPRFFHTHPQLRDQLLSQVRPALTYRESVPYTERICQIQIRQHDLLMHFL